MSSGGRTVFQKVITQRNNDLKTIRVLRMRSIFTERIAKTESTKVPGRSVGKLLGLGNYYFDDTVVP